MARRSTHAPLTVFLNTRLVGRLSKQPNGAVSFVYDATWLAAENAIPVSLSMPLREERYAGAAVIAALDNLLPDGPDLRRRVAERVGAEGDDAYSLLEKIGRDCVGALQFLPDGNSPEPADAARSEPLDEASIAHKLMTLSAAPLGMGDDDADFRISLAGAQEKTALLHWQNGWRTPHGSTPTTHILKPQIGKLRNGVDMSQSVENEFLCMQLTAAFGLPTANVAIADFNGVRALVVERFDRNWRSDTVCVRLPQEDFCQALGVAPTKKYQSDGGPGNRAALDLLRASDHPELDRLTFLKAQIVFWLLGATDGHAKNFSVFLGPRGAFRMTPLYDVLSAQPAVDAHQIDQNRMKLAMSVGDSRHYVVGRIAARHFFETAKTAGIPADDVKFMADNLLGEAEPAIARVFSTLPPDFPAPLADRVIAGLRRRLGAFRLMPPTSGG